MSKTAETEFMKREQKYHDFSILIDYLRPLFKNGLILSLLV
jgi:hypothetical protein